MQIFREENVIINVNILHANNLPLLRDKGRLFFNKWWLLFYIFTLYKVLPEVLAARWQLVVHQRGQHLTQLQEQSLAGRVVVGKHAEFGSKFQAQSFKQLCVLAFEQRGRGDGDGLVHLHLESKSLCDPLNRQVAELLQFVLFHNHLP